MKIYLKENVSWRLRKRKTDTFRERERLGRGSGGKIKIKDNCLKEICRPND